MKETLQTLVRTVGELTDSTYSRPLADAIQVVAQLRGEDAPQPAAPPQPTPPFTADVPRVLEVGNLHRLVQQYQAAFKVTFYRPIVSGRKLLGAPARFVKKVIRKGTAFLVAPVVDDQNTFNAYATETLDELVRNDQRTQAFMDAITPKVEQLHDAQQQLETVLMHRMEGRLQTLTNAYRTEQVKLHALMDEMDALRAQVRQLSSVVGALQRQLRAAQNVPAASPAPAPAPSHAGEAAQGDVYASIDYAAFEDHFRGSRAQIQQGQRQYVPYFLGRSNVVDLGCGRGEFLELLRENGVDARGVDLYAPFVTYCTQLGLNVQHAEAISFLRQAADNSLGGLFAAQLIEHLPPDQLTTLCQQAYRALQPGGTLVLETPNPCSLFIYTHAFYIDPSHQRPVHPETMAFLLRQAGFEDIERIHPESSRVPYALPPVLSEAEPNREAINEGFQLLSEQLFGCQDYAIVARKPLTEETP